MRIPATLLSATALRAIVEEFITRDGTDHSSIDPRVNDVMRQLAEGSAEIHFDNETETCNIITLSAGLPEAAKKE